jgi:2-hydroxymuconate-semialdehyde hydrolase
MTRLITVEAQDIMLAPWSSEEGKRALFRNFRRDAIPGARLTWVDEAAHWVMEERPAEVAAALKAFLADEGD